MGFADDYGVMTSPYAYGIKNVLKPDENFIECD